MSQLSTTVWLVLEPTHDVTGRAVNIRVDRIVQSKPPRLGIRHAAFALTITVDSSQFEQFLPAVTVMLNAERQLLMPGVIVHDQHLNEEATDDDSDAPTP